MYPLLRMSSVLVMFGRLCDLAVAPALERCPLQPLISPEPTSQVSGLHSDLGLSNLVPGPQATASTWAPGDPTVHRKPTEWAPCHSLITWCGPSVSSKGCDFPPHQVPAPFCGSGTPRCLHPTSHSRRPSPSCPTRPGFLIGPQHALPPAPGPLHELLLLPIQKGLLHASGPGSSAGRC